MNRRSQSPYSAPNQLPVWTRIKRWCKNRWPIVVSMSVLKRWKHRYRSHDDVYGQDYFDMVEHTSGASATIMSRTIVNLLRPRTVIDVGCGPGNLISHLQSQGVTVLGLDYSKHAIEMGRAKSLQIIPFDATLPGQLDQHFGRFDLAMCIEVAQQLPPKVAYRLVGFLCNHADVVLFSAPSCADDRNPKCPRPRSHWVRAFQSFGYRIDETISAKLKDEWKQAGTANWFSRDPLIFRSTLDESSRS